MGVLVTHLHLVSYLNAFSDGVTSVTIFVLVVDPVFVLDNLFFAQRLVEPSPSQKSTNRALLCEMFRTWNQKNSHLHR
jgi:hypothetical protein